MTFLGKVYELLLYAVRFKSYKLSFLKLRRNLNGITANLAIFHIFLIGNRRVQQH